MNATGSFFNWSFRWINKLYYIDDVKTRAPVFLGVQFDTYWYAYRQVIKFNTSPSFNLPYGIPCYDTGTLPNYIVARNQIKRQKHLMHTDISDGWLRQRLQPDHKLSSLDKCALRHPPICSEVYQGLHADVLQIRVGVLKHRNLCELRFQESE